MEGQLQKMLRCDLANSTAIARQSSAIEGGRDLSSMSGILADTAYRLLLA
jgi:hypothetical protein